MYYSIDLQSLGLCETPFCSCNAVVEACCFIHPSCLLKYSNTAVLQHHVQSDFILHKYLLNPVIVQAGHLPHNHIHSLVINKN